MLKGLIDLNFLRFFIFFDRIIKDTSGNQEFNLKQV